MEKLLNIKTDPKRAISAINPDSDREKAKKQIDLREVSLKIKK